MSTPQGRISHTDFAKRVKTKYSEYGDVDDLELSRRIVAKYPEYASRVSLPSFEDTYKELNDTFKTKYGRDLYETGDDTPQHRQGGKVGRARDLRTHDLDDEQLGYLTDEAKKRGFKIFDYSRSGPKTLPSGMKITGPHMHIEYPEGVGGGLIEAPKPTTPEAGVQATIDELRTNQHVEKPNAIALGRTQPSDGGSTFAPPPKQSARAPLAANVHGALAPGQTRAAPRPIRQNKGFEAAQAQMEGRPDQSQYIDRSAAGKRQRRAVQPIETPSNVGRPSAQPDASGQYPVGASSPVSEELQHPQEDALGTVESTINSGLKVARDVVSSAGAFIPKLFNIPGRILQPTTPEQAQTSEAADKLTAEMNMLASKYATESGMLAPNQWSAEDQAKRAQLSDEITRLQMDLREQKHAQDIADPKLLQESSQQMERGRQQISRQGQKPGLGKTVAEGVGGVLPALGAAAIYPPAAPLLIGGLTAAEEYGSGAPVDEAAGAGVTSAASIAAMGGAGKAINATSLGRLAKIAGNALANSGVAIGTQAMLGDKVIPETPEEKSQFISARILDLAFALHSNAHGKMSEKQAVDAAKEQVAQEVGGAQPTGRRVRHQDFGEGTVDVNQQGVPKGYRRVIFDDGGPKTIRVVGKNQRAQFIREPETRAVAEPDTQHGASQTPQFAESPPEQRPPATQPNAAEVVAPGAAPSSNRRVVRSDDGRVGIVQTGKAGTVEFTEVTNPRTAKKYEGEGGVIPTGEFDALFPRNPEGYQPGTIEQSRARFAKDEGLGQQGKVKGLETPLVKQAVGQTAKSGVEPEPGTVHNFSSTQVDLPKAQAAPVLKLGRSIPDKDLAADGRESNPHITVKYGIHSADAAELRPLLANEKPITATIGKTSTFKGVEDGTADAVIAEVDSPDLHRLNKIIADAMPHTDTHPDYKPHVTVAYVKPGLGEKYAGREDLKGTEITLSEITFSGKNGEVITIPLGERRQDTAERKRVEAMTPEERSHALLTHELTGIPNKRAYDESNAADEASGTPSHHAALDVVGLKATNKTLGDQGGDDLLRKVAQALEEEHPGRVFHLSGDSFKLKGASPEELATVMESIRERLKNAIVEGVDTEGNPAAFKGIELHHGIGENADAANAALRTSQGSAAKDATGRILGTVSRETGPGKQVESNTPTPEAGSRAGGSRESAPGQRSQDVTKERALPQTVDAADIGGGGSNRTYKPESIVDASEAGRAIVAEKGVDGAIEHVKNGTPDINWASTGYAAMEQLRAEEARIRATDPLAADRIAQKRLDFVGDFAQRATELGQAIAGIRAIEEFAPDRFAYQANKASMKNRKKGLSLKEDARIKARAQELVEANNRIKALEEAAAKARIAKEGKKGGSAPKGATGRLKASADTALERLTPRLGNLDFGSLTRPEQRGAVGERGKLPGDAELIAQYGAATLGKSDLETWTADLIKAVPEAEPYLKDIRRRAYEISAEEKRADTLDRLADMGTRKTASMEIAQEIREAIKATKEAEAAAKLAKRQAVRTRESDRKTVEKIQEGLRLEGEAEAARQRQAEARKTAREANKAQRKGYRETLKAEREAERNAERWDTPLRDEATAARQRLNANPDPKAPTTMEDLVSVAVERLLPAEQTGGPRMNRPGPMRFYADLKSEFPGLVTRKTQAEIYKRAYQRTQDMVAATREVARQRSANKEVDRQWNEMGIDVGTQAILIQRAEAQRRRLEAQAEMVREFNRVSRPMWKRVGHEAISMPRALQSSIDAPIGRQGLFYTLTRPIQSGRAMFPATAKGYTSWTRADYQKLIETMRRHPDFDLADRAGLDLTKMASEGDPRFAAEEAFQSTWAERLPHVRLSEQGYNAGMNAQRLAIFSAYADLGRTRGYTWETNPEFFQQAARRVNIFTGRGDLSAKAQTVVSWANGLFYSARLQVARVQMLNEMLNPKSYIKADPAMRRIMAGEAIRTAAAMGLIYGTAKAIGLGVTFDPDDPDFGKIRVGNTRYDVTGGESSAVRLIARLVTLAAQMVTGTPEERKENKRKAVAIGENAIRYKLAPVPQATWSWLGAQDAVGKDTTAEKEGLKLLTPMFVNDIIDASIQEGWVGAAKTAPAILGLGVQTYQQDAKSKGPTLKSRTLQQPRWREKILQKSAQ